MRSSAKAFVMLGMLSIVGIVLFSSSVTAMRFSSTDYIIDTAVLNNVGGYSSSTNYQLTSTGGEAAIGNGASGSYKLAAGYVAQIITPAITVKTQPTGLVEYYPLDENSGTVAHDNTTNANFGTLRNGTTWTSSGKIGAAVDFGGVGDLMVPYSSTLLPHGGTGLTIELWTKSTGMAANKALATQWDYTGGTNNGGAWALTRSSSGTGLRFTISSGVTDTGTNYAETGSGLMSANTWYHVVATYDGTQSAGNRVQLYINGVSRSSTITGTIPSTLSPDTSNFYLGDFHGLNRQLDGMLDQVKIFNRALSAQEVSAEYTAQNAGVETGLTLQTVIPGVSNTSNFNVITLTSGSSYNLAISQNNNLTNGSYTIPAVSGSIASPVAWTEGTTKGLGFTVVSSTATAPSASWSSGNSYAALPGAATSFYTRTGTQSSGADVVSMRLRLDVANTQASGSYSNTMTVTGTANP